MKRRTLFRILGGVACALGSAGLARPAAAADWIPVERIDDRDPDPIIEPTCPDCDSEPPADLVVETDTEATLVVYCDDAPSEPIVGTLVVEVELDDGMTVRIHREPGFSWSGVQCGRSYETTLYAGPGWTWDSVTRARIAVIPDEFAPREQPRR